MKKGFKITLIIVLFILLLSLIFFIVDYSRASEGKSPVFCIFTDEVNDGGTRIYLGLGYKVIDFNTLSGFTDIKIGSYFMDYEDFHSEIEKANLAQENLVSHTENSSQKYSKTIDNVKLDLDIPNDWKYDEMPEDKDSYKYALKIYKNDASKYAIITFSYNPFAVCGTGRTSKDITLDNGKTATIGYYDNNKNWTDISFYEMNKYIYVLNCGLIDSDANEVIDFIKTLNIITEQKEFSFCGTITQVEKNLFFVKPDESEEISKSGDKIMVQKLKIDSDVKFEIGERVKITYDGDIMDTYPLQIKAIKYESIK